MSFAQLNLDIFRLINDLGKEYDFLNPIVVFLAEYTLYLLGLSMAVYWLTRTHKNRLMIIQSVIAFIFAEILGKIAGLLHSHYQPFAVLPDVNTLIEHGIDNSFPSDHSILFFSICVSIWLVRKKEGWLWLVLACCVAVSRIWVGVHYPVDVAAGAFLGIISALVVHGSVRTGTLISRWLVLYEKVEQRLLPPKKERRSETR